MATEHTTHLRVRVTDEEVGLDRRIEVLDQDGNVLGDLINSAVGVAWKMGLQGEMSVLVLELAAQRSSVDSLELKGINLRAA